MLNSVKLKQEKRRKREREREIQRLLVCIDTYLVSVKSVNESREVSIKYWYEEPEIYGKNNVAAR